MKDVLVTGGSGFIGRNIKESYLNAKYNIMYPTHNELDLLDAHAVAMFFLEHNIDVVFHTAVSYSGIQNILMYLNIRNNIPSHCKLINFSSGAIYDKARSIEFIDESEVWLRQPTDEYGLSKKVCFELQPRDNVIDLVLFGVFGKYELSSRLIPSIIKAYASHKFVTLRGIQRMSYIYVYDLIRILDVMLNEWPSLPIMNVTSDSFYLSDVCKIVANVMGVGSKYICRKEKLNDYTADSGVLRMTYPNFKFTPIEQAIKELIPYYMEVANA